MDENYIMLLIRNH